MTPRSGRAGLDGRENRNRNAGKVDGEHAPASGQTAGVDPAVVGFHGPARVRMTSPFWGFRGVGSRGWRIAQPRPYCPLPTAVVCGACEAQAQGTRFSLAFEYSAKSLPGSALSNTSSNSFSLMKV